jgi:hypothetical protein
MTVFAALALAIAFSFNTQSAFAQGAAETRADAAQSAATAQQSPFASEVLGDWVINANGYIGNLNISSVDVNGNLRGIYNSLPIFGYYDGISKKIIFMLIVSYYDLTRNQIYTGYLFTGPYTPKLVMAGSYECFYPSLGGPFHNNIFGWTAYR